MKKKIITFILYALFILLTELFVLRDTFVLALFGDDWFTFSRYIFYLGPSSPEKFTQFSYFFTVYGPQDSILALMNHFFGYQSHYYYGISFILRYFAALSIYPLVYSLTKSKFTGFIGSLFFAISFIGIESTNWVFNMPSYIAIIFFNIFLFILISRKNINIKKGIIVAILFYITFITQPIRMTGLPIIIIALETFLLIKKPIKRNFFDSLLLFSFITVAFLIVKYFGQSISTSGEMVQRVTTGLSTISTQLTSGHIDILMNPFIILGSLFIPDTIWQHTGNIGVNISSFFLPILITYMLIVLLFYQGASVMQNRKYFLLTNSIIAILWTLSVRFIFIHTPAFSDPFKVGTALVGGYFLILSTSLIQQCWKKDKSFPIFLSLVVIIFSFIIPWFFSPSGYFSTAHRYLIVTSVGVGIFWATLLSLFTRSFSYYLFLVILGAFFLLQIQSNNLFFHQLSISRSISISDSIWQQLEKELPNFRTIAYPTIVYFEGDSTNSDTLYQVITFGFPPHIGLLYDIPHDDKRLPVPITGYQELHTIVKTGKPLNAYGHIQKPTPIEQIFAFRLEGRKTIKNITPEIREQLQKDNQ